MADSITVTVPAVEEYGAVVNLVLGGVGSRLDLPYEQMDDLQLAVLSVLEAASDGEVTLEMEAEDEGLSVSIGPLRDGVGSDTALANVLRRLVGGVEETLREGRPWLLVRVSRTSPP